MRPGLCLPCPGPLHIARSFHIPGCDKIQHAKAFDVAHDALEIGFLCSALFFFAQERRIAQHIAAALGGQHLLPIQRQRIAVDDVRAVFQGNAGKVQAKLFAHTQIHLVIDQPQGHLGDLRRELFNLDAVKLIDVQADELVDIQRLLTALP